MEIKINSLYSDREVTLRYTQTSQAPKFKLFERSNTTIDILSVILDFVVYDNEYDLIIEDKIYNTKKINLMKDYFMNKFLTNKYLYHRFKDGELESELSIYLMEILVVNNILDVNLVNSKYFDLYNYQNFKSDFEYMININEKVYEIRNLNILKLNEYYEITFEIDESDLKLLDIEDIKIYKDNLLICDINSQNTIHKFNDKINKIYYFRISKDD